MLSDEIRSAMFARRDWAPKRKNGRVHFRCPRHEDRKPSAWMEDGSWGCFACGFTESIITLAPELGIETRGGGYTLEDYADSKGFPLTNLREFGLETVEERGREVVRIPYYGSDGKLLRCRFRSREAKWWEGRNRPIYLYGVNRLGDIGEKGDVLLVEGESDCHAAWLGGFHAVGVPGATCWKTEWAKFFSGLNVYIWEEPDQAGAQFSQAVASDLPDARIIHAEAVKDVADLYRQTGKGFGDALRSLMVTATKAGTPKPPVTFDALIGDHIDRLLERKLRPIDAVPVPFASWREACCDEGGRQGIARGWHVVAAARTGTGKSVLALNVAATAIRAGERVCFISLEMDQPQLETRLMALFSGTEVKFLEQGKHFNEHRFHKAGETLSQTFRDTGGVFYSNRQPVHTLDAVISSFHYNHEVHGARCFIVDYMQLAGNPNDPESITQVSHRVRQATKDLSVATFALSQFNRQTNVSKERPSCYGLFGGSALEQDADQVLLLDHSRMDRAVPPREGWDGFLVLDKNRHGPNAEIPIYFDTRTLGITERYADEEPSVEKIA